MIFHGSRIHFMEKEMVIIFLRSIAENDFIKVPLNGDQIIDIVKFSTTNELVYRTELGNFKVSQKGHGLINEIISWVDLYHEGL